MSIVRGIANSSPMFATAGDAIRWRSGLPPPFPSSWSCRAPPPRTTRRADPSPLADTRAESGTAQQTSVSSPSSVHRCSSSQAPPSATTTTASSNRQSPAWRHSFPLGNSRRSKRASIRVLLMSSSGSIGSSPAPTSRSSVSTGVAADPAEADHGRYQPNARRNWRVAYQPISAAVCAHTFMLKSRIMQLAPAVPNSSAAPKWWQTSWATTQASEALVAFGEIITTPPR